MYDPLPDCAVIHTGAVRMRDPDSYSRDKNPAEAFKHPSRERRPVLSRRQPRKRKLTLEEQLEENRQAINRQIEVGDVFYVGGLEHIKNSAFKKYCRLWRERFDLQQRLGPLLSSGISMQTIRNGVSYSVTPLLGNFEEALAAFNSESPTPYGPHTQRDRIVRVLFSSRRKGAIEVVKVSKDGRQCFSSFPRITKAYLRRRFKLRSRYLARILKKPLRIVLTA